MFTSLDDGVLFILSVWIPGEYLEMGTFIFRLDWIGLDWIG